MYQDVNDFLEKTAKTRLAKEYLKAVAEGPRKSFAQAAKNGLRSEDLNDLSRGLKSVGEKLSPYDLPSKRVTIDKVLKTPAAKDAGLIDLKDFSPIGLTQGMSKKAPSVRVRKRYTPATNDEIMGSLQSPMLRESLSENNAGRLARRKKSPGLMDFGRDARGYYGALGI